MVHGPLQTILNHKALLALCQVKCQVLALVILFTLPKAMGPILTVSIHKISFHKPNITSHCQVEPQVKTKDQAHKEPSHTIVVRVSMNIKEPLI